MNPHPAQPGKSTAAQDALDSWLGKPSREHFTVYGLKNHRFEASSRWFSGAADVRTYELDELLGTKLRALYQRKKGARRTI